MDIGCDVHVFLAIVYGKTDGDRVQQSRDVTNSILQAVKLEMTKHPDAPKLLIGDFNAHLSNFEEASDLVAHHGWIDEGRDAGPTCLANRGPFTKLES